MIGIVGALGVFVVEAVVVVVVVVAASRASSIQVVRAGGDRRSFVTVGLAVLVRGHRRRGRGRRGLRCE